MKESLPERPAEKIDKYVREYCLSSYDAKLLAEYRRDAEFFEDSVKDLKNKETYKKCSNLILSLIFSKFETENEKQEFKFLVSSKEMRGFWGF